MGSAAKMFKKAVGMKVGGVQPIKPVQQVQEEKQVVERTKAQTGADASRRRRRSGRVGQRNLLYASRLGGGGSGRGEDQSTLGS